MANANTGSKPLTSRTGPPPAQRTAGDVEANRRWFESKLRAERQITDVVHKVKGDVEIPGSDFLIVDARSRDAYAKGHIPGALSVPLKEFDRLVGHLPRDKELMTYCGSKT